jgi:hypothetical protein
LDGWPPVPYRAQDTWQSHIICFNSKALLSTGINGSERDRTGGGKSDHGQDECALSEPARARQIAERQCLPDKLMSADVVRMALWLKAAQNFIVDAGWV